MDALLTLAILSCGAFICVGMAGILYLALVRPRLLAEMGGGTPEFADPTIPSQPMLTLTQPDPLLKNAGKFNLAGGALSVAAAQLQQHSQWIESLAEQLAQQDEQLQRIHTQMMKTPISETVASLIGQQGAHLNRLARQLVRLDANLGDTPISDQTYQQLAQIQHHLTTLAPKIVSQNSAIQQVLTRQFEAVPRSADASMSPPTHLEDMPGLGIIHTAILLEAGIESPEKLATLTPGEIRALIHIPRWREADVENWLAQAKLRVAWIQESEKSR